MGYRFHFLWPDYFLGSWPARFTLVVAMRGGSSWQELLLRFRSTIFTRVVLMWRGGSWRESLRKTPGGPSEPAPHLLPPGSATFLSWTGAGLRSPLCARHHGAITIRVPKQKSLLFVPLLDLLYLWSCISGPISLFPAGGSPSRVPGGPRDKFQSKGKNKNRMSGTAMRLYLWGYDFDSSNRKDFCPRTEFCLSEFFLAIFLKY